MAGSMAFIAGTVSKISGKPRAAGSIFSNYVLSMGGKKLNPRGDGLQVGDVATLVSGSDSFIDNVGEMVGVKSDLYTIGRIGEDSMGDGILGSISRAVTIFNDILDFNPNSDNEISIENLQKKGVVIDGFDNVQGEMGIAIHTQPVMYDTSKSDGRVRTPSVLVQRVYISNNNTDDFVDDIMKSASNAFGGIGNMIFGTGDTRSQRVLKSLQALQEKGTVFRVYTYPKIWDNMLIQKIKVQNSRGQNDLLVADITYKEIVFYTTLGSGKSSVARSIPSAIASGIATVAGWLR